MNKLDPPEEPRVRALLARPVWFAAGLGAGLILWTIIALATSNTMLGVLFGLAPGLAIGLGLQLTAKRP